MKTYKNIFIIAILITSPLFALEQLTAEPEKNQQEISETQETTNLCISQSEKAAEVKKKPNYRKWLLLAATSLALPGLTYGEFKLAQYMVADSTQTLKNIEHSPNFAKYYSSNPQCQVCDPYCHQDSACEDMLSQHMTANAEGSAGLALEVLAPLVNFGCLAAAYAKACCPKKNCCTENCNDDDYHMRGRGFGRHR
jgi:hypothetical protein